MTEIASLTSLLNWKIESGSHEWPGPDGGTCINEAAIVAAGFPYKAVSQASDCPPCFSPVVSAYLIRLNDILNDDDRQLLIPFVTRLSGSADTDQIERQRLNYIFIETIRQIVSRAMDAADLPDQARACRDVSTVAQARTTSTRAAKAAWAARAARAAEAAEAA